MSGQEPNNTVTVTLTLDEVHAIIANIPTNIYEEAKSARDKLWNEIKGRPIPLGDER